MDSRSAGMLIVGAGVVAIIVGVLVMTGALGWFGRLPGDVRVESGNVRVYFPIVSMLLVSIVLSVIAAVIRRLF